MVIIFTTFCSIPNNKNKVLIGDNSGKLFIGELKDLISINMEDQISQSLLENLIEIYSLEKVGTSYTLNLEGRVEARDKYPSIRNIICLSDTEIVGHSDYGDVFLVNFKDEGFNIEIIEVGSFNRNNRMYSIASINPDNFIISGNYGVFWFYNRNNEGIWEVIKKEQNMHAHFAVNVYDYESESYIANNFRGETRILDKNGFELLKLYGFNSNLQNIIILIDLIAAVDYYGNCHIYSKSESNDTKYINIQTIDCDTQTNVYPRILFHNDFFYAQFPNKLWRFDLELDSIQSLDLKSKDINIIDDNIAVLTTNDLLIVNTNFYITPEDYINYNYLKAGIVGYTDTGKSTFCYKMIYGEYKDDLRTTSGTLTWCFECDDGNKIFIKDIPGQHDEIDFYFPKLKDCDIIIGMCKIKDTITPWKDTIDMCEKLRNDYNMEHFIFLRSKSDDRGKARKETIQEYLEEKEFDKELLFDVSAKNGDGIEEIIDLLSDPIYWEKKKISTENKIKTQLISTIGRFRSKKLDKIELGHFKLEGFEDLNPKILEKFIKKIAEEGDLYYISSSKQLILDTESMGFVESFILNLFSECEGLISETSIIKELKKNFSEMELEELKYYFEEFMNYLISVDRIIEIFPTLFVIPSKIPDILNIPENLLCTEIKIKNPLPVMEIFSLFEKPNVFFEEIAGNGFKFRDQESGVIFIELPEIHQFNINNKSSSFKIYLKNSVIIRNIFEEFYEKLRRQGLIDLPRILDFNKLYDDELENLYYLFNYPDETPILDFKREIAYPKRKGKVLKKIQKEILKDIIALGNSSYLYNNSAYLIIGLEEKNGNFKSIKEVKNQSVLLQQIAYLCRRYLNPVFNISPISIEINKIFNLTISGKIAKNIPFTPGQKKSSCQEKIMIIHITRVPKECLELNETISWESKKGIKKILKGMSWIRIGSHTFEISNEERKKLFTS